MSTKKRPVKRPFSQDFSGDSQTDPSQQAGADVNVIVANYARQHDGRPVHQHPDPQDYRDFPSHDYGEAIRRIAEIDSAFEDLPAAERALHENNPEIWLLAAEQQALEPDTGDLLDRLAEPLRPSSPAAEPETTEGREGE
nr:MAG: internal scaffolding protein [Microvirus sp.]